METELIGDAATAKIARGGEEKGRTEKKEKKTAKKLKKGRRKDKVKAKKTIKTKKKENTKKKEDDGEGKRGPPPRMCRLTLLILLVLGRV